ncbi:MAG: T9SS type A sorting domain-containing protein [Bacteroidetes bacterium]|nr:T9SS type A sorting domain-containing protein [Bacteroidota bacterium]
MKISSIAFMFLSVSDFAQTNELYHGEKLTIVSTDGKLVFSETINSNITTIPFAELSTGIYLVKIGSGTKKLVRLF